jgi:putative oxidoreductase
MFGRDSEPKLIFPGLAGFYASVSDLWYPMIRFTVGALLFAHGFIKIGSGVAGVTASMAKSGFEPAAVFAYAAIFIELVGGACIALGLFTRFFAAMAAIQLACITFVVMMPQGLFRLEGTLIWGIVMFAIALRGGGPYSLDRKIGKEL